jgi:hypothetical protein
LSSSSAPSLSLSNPASQSTTEISTSARDKLMQLNSKLVNRFYNTSSSACSFAGNLFRFLFKDEDLEGKNAYGRIFKSNALPKDSCDPAVIEEVRKIVMKKYKDADLKNCVRQINQII